MDDFRDPADKAFASDEVAVLIRECIESCIQNSVYHHQKVPQWCTNIVELCLKRLTGLNKPYKYIVTCLIMQRCGAGLHCANSCYWDPSTDGAASFKYESKTIHAIVNVYGLAI